MTSRNLRSGLGEELTALLGGGMGRVIDEPETLTPKEKVVKSLTQVINNARAQAAQHAQAADDAQTILDDILARKDDDPFVHAAARVYL